MKHSKADVVGKATTSLTLRFETQALTSYSGLIVFQHFFAQMGLKERLRGCFRHLKVNPIYGHPVIMMLLVVHLVLGHRRLRDLEYYRDDAMVKRVLGLKRLADVATVSRDLASADERSVEKVREMSTSMVLERLAEEKLARVTLDEVSVETRIDSAFFNETITNTLHGAGVAFTISVPFERFAELKTMIEGRKRWRTLDEGLSYFETQWKPKSWSSRYRFLFSRKRVLRQRKASIQLDLFIPREHDYDYKVIVTNKTVGPGAVVAFHEGRGSQEGIFAELKTDCQMDYIPVTT